MRAGGTAIKTLFTGGKRRGGRSFPEVRRCCSRREIDGVLPKSIGDRRSGRVIPGMGKVATDSKADCHVRPTRAITSFHSGSRNVSIPLALRMRHSSNSSSRARDQKPRIFRNAVLGEQQTGSRRRKNKLRASEEKKTRVVTKSDGKVARREWSSRATGQMRTSRVKASIAANSGEFLSTAGGAEN